VIGFFFGLAVSALSGLAGPGTPSTLDCHGVQVRLSALDPVQGSIVLVEVDGASSTSDVALTWSGRPVPFWREGGRAPLRALVGIDLARPAGETSLLLSQGPGQSCRADLSVRAGDFGERELTVSKRFVELSARDQARARREAARLEAIFGKTSSERLWQAAFRLPLDEAEPSPNFGQRRILNGEPRSQHSGVDFSAPTGTPVRATQRGRVVLASSLFWSGGTVILDHGLGLFSFYGHLSAVQARAGQLLKAGAVLGRVGATGRATGPHLHWSVRLNGARVNPLDLVSLPSH